MKAIHVTIYDPKSLMSVPECPEGDERKAGRTFMLEKDGKLEWTDKDSVWHFYVIPNRARESRSPRASKIHTTYRRFCLPKDSVFQKILASATKDAEICVSGRHVVGILPTIFGPNRGLTDQRRVKSH